MQEIEKIDRLVEPKDSNFQTVETSLGGFWRSEHLVESGVEYRTQLPPGLNLGAGIADIRTYSNSIGQKSASGPVITLLHLPLGCEEEFHTRIGPGVNTSCGLYIPPCDYDDLPKPVRSLLQLLPKDETFYACTQVPRSIVARLCQPFESWRNPAAMRLAGEARVYELLALLIESTSSKGAPLKQHLQQKVLLARELIDSHLSKPLSLKQLAEQVGLNVRSLTHYFRQASGMSIGEYQHYQRMEQALRLLEAGLSVSQTADQLGYSLPYFSQKFRQRYGLAASEVSPRVLDIKPRP